MKTTSKAMSELLPMTLYLNLNILMNISYHVLSYFKLQVLAIALTFVIN